MSYWIEDKDGFAGDVASNSGFTEMTQQAGPKLDAFLDSGKLSTEDEIAAVVKELSGTKFDYLARILRECEPPVVITDGVIEDDSDEEE